MLMWSAAAQTSTHKLLLVYPELCITICYVTDWQNTSKLKSSGARWPVQLRKGARRLATAMPENIVTVTDSSGKWKQYSADAFGQLVHVTEQSPNPFHRTAAYVERILKCLHGKPQSQGDILSRFLNFPGGLCIVLNRCPLTGQSVRTYVTPRSLVVAAAAHLPGAFALHRLCNLGGLSR